VSGELQGLSRVVAAGVLLAALAGCAAKESGATAETTAPPVVQGSLQASPTPTPSQPTAPAAQAQAQTTEQELAAMDDITAAFENGKAAPQYAFIKDQKDGCGYTAGWIGFCTADGDLLDTVKAYNDAVPGNVLRKYTGALTKLASTKSTDTAPLGKTFVADWQKAALDPLFQKIQLQVGHTSYLEPARRLARTEGITTPLGLENLYDTALMMGPSKTDCDGVLKLAAETDKALGGSPAKGVVKEADWIVRYDQIRIKHLQNPCTPGRKADWPKAVGRVQALQGLATAGNWRLDPPIRLGGSVDLTITAPVH
jgi:chitosanase